MLNCLDERRREKVRAKAGWNGLDYVEVNDAQTSLTVYFLGKAPEGIHKENIAIEGGRTEKDAVHVIAVDLQPEAQADLDDRMLVHVDKSGDFSTYTMRLIGLERIDPHCDRVEFSFKVNCPSDLDCAAQPPCPVRQFPRPAIDYLAKDYASFRQLILDRLSLIMPAWRERHVPDLGIMLVELLAYAGDYLSYYQDAVATEAYLETARRRPSVRRHAKLVDYVLSEGCNARTLVCLETGCDLDFQAADVFFVTSLKVLLPISDKAALLERELGGLAPEDYEVFEPLLPHGIIRVWKANNILRFYSWGDRECCLEKGSMRATLRGRLAVDSDDRHGEDGKNSVKQQALPYNEQDASIHLKPGDLLVFQEVKGPNTGHPEDADPNHRHPVRLTGVKQAMDPLTGDPVIEIEWSEDDALPFDLCLSSLGAPPECEFNEDVSIARGNVVLVDHGRKAPSEPLGTVPLAGSEVKCECEGHPGEIETTAGRYRPRLARAPLTFAQPLPEDGPAPAAIRSAAALLAQDPRKALPALRLESIPPRSDGTGPAFDWAAADSGDLGATSTWEVRADLLRSGPDDPHFVVEMEEDGTANLRFGDDVLGEAPDAGTAFRARYRVGNGPRGNVGAVAIQVLVHRFSNLGDDVTWVGNPLPATGGTAAEPMAEAKLNAPFAFRIGTEALQRAIIADDYARIAERDRRIQRAAVRLVWTGSWFEAEVAVDPFAAATRYAARLLGEIEAELEKYRRIGHDLDVRRAQSVPIELGLKVCVAPSYLRGHVNSALLDAFSNRALAGGKLGYFHRDRLSCGDDIYVSRIIAEAQAVPGVASVEVTRLQRQFEASNREIENGVLPLGPFEIAQLYNDPNYPDRGRLEIELAGGR